MEREDPIAMLQGVIESLDAMRTPIGETTPPWRGGFVAITQDQVVRIIAPGGLVQGSIVVRRQALQFRSVFRRRQILGVE